MSFGVDFSEGRPSITTLKANGVTFVIRYLYPGAAKGLTAAEYQEYKGAAIAVVVVFEGASQGALGGRAQGAADAQMAVAQLAAIGLPATIPIYFAVDFDATAAQMATIAQYFLGVASVIGLSRVGAYGGLAVIEYLHTNGLATFFWQTYAWSAGSWAPVTHIQQYLNGQWGDEVDFDRSMTTDFGQDTGATAGGQGDVDMTSIDLVNDGTGQIWYSVNRMFRYAVTPTTFPDYAYYMGTTLANAPGVVFPTGKPQAATACQVVKDIAAFGVIVQNATAPTVESLTEAEIDTIATEIAKSLPATLTLAQAQTAAQAGAAAALKATLTAAAAAS